MVVRVSLSILATLSLKSNTSMHLYPIIEDHTEKVTIGYYARLPSCMHRWYTIACLLHQQVHWIGVDSFILHPQN